MVTIVVLDQGIHMEITIVMGFMVTLGVLDQGYPILNTLWESNIPSRFLVELCIYGYSYDRYTSGNDEQFAIEAMAKGIVDAPIENRGSFHTIVI